MSKLNPQNATAYVGPGVLRKGGKITKVPNGPLIKKTGKFKGSTLKAGGRIKKAQNGDTLNVKKPTVSLSPYMQKRADQKVKNAVRLAPFEASQEKKYANWKNSDSKNINKTYEDWQKELVKGQQGENAPLEGMRTIGKDDEGCAPSPKARKKRLEKEAKRKNGGPIKKAILGAVMGMSGGKDNSIYKNTTNLRGKLGGSALGIPGMKPIVKNGSKIKKAKAGAMIKRAQNGESFTKDGNEYTYTKQVTRPEGKRKYEGKSIDQATAMKIANFKIRNNPSDSLRTVKPVIKKNGGMIKRDDGSTSKRGLWDNIRKNKGSGKKPTKQMLVQEKKIKAKSKK